MGAFSQPIQGAIHLLSRKFTADQLGEGWRRGELLEDRPITARYGNVPAEAFPILESAADGCHYALWIDDARQELEPPVAWISPADGTPETVWLVAETVSDFCALTREAGLWRDGDERIVAAAREKALAARRKVISFETSDGLGVVAGAEPALERPTEQTLARWRADEQATFDKKLLRDGAPGLALAVARDLIAQHDAAGIAGFGELCAKVYRALGRNLLADVAVISYQ